jgi:hypothetical protein
MKFYVGMEVKLHAFLTLALEESVYWPHELRLYFQVSSRAYLNYEKGRNLMSSSGTEPR